MKRTRRRFNVEFKQEALRLVRERGVSVAQAAEEMEIHQNMLRTWLKAVGPINVQRLSVYRVSVQSGAGHSCRPLQR